MPKISVVVPVYNVEKFLERCLNSIVNQTFKDIEIICVNDGSTDNSRKILDKYTNYSNIKIIDQINAGLSEARNTGLLNAKGEYIAFIDSDDYIDPNFFEVLYNTAFEKNSDIECAGIIRENNKKKIELDSSIKQYEEIEKIKSDEQDKNLADKKLEEENIQIKEAEKRRLQDILKN